MSKLLNLKHKTGSGARLGGDDIVFHIIVVAGVVGVALASFTISFTSLLAVAQWQEYPEEIHFLTAVQIDLPVIVFSVATIIFKYREQRLPEWVCRLLSMVMTLISAGANFMHTVSIRGLDDYTDWIGASFNALAPMLVFACSEILGALITRPKPARTVVVKLREDNKELKNENTKLKRDAKKKNPTTTAATAEIESATA